MSDSELQELRRRWQAAPGVGLDIDAIEKLRRRVLRETRASRIALIVPVLVTLIIGGGVLVRASRQTTALHAVLAIEAWIFIAVTWAGALWIARGTWRPLADTTSAFVAVSIKRREANLRGASFAAGLYVLQLSFVVLLSILATPAAVGAVLSSPYVILFGWLGLPIGAVALGVFRRRQQAELERLREIARQLEAG